MKALYDSIRDPSEEVTIAAIEVLNEIINQDGIMNLNSKIVFYLLNRFEDFTV